MTEKLELSIDTLNLALGYLKRQTWEDVDPIIRAIHVEIIPQLNKEGEYLPAGGTD